jgi:UDP-N-acetylmuramoyl-tripeptide--D-alanyl-D-alanine ligase
MSAVLTSTRGWGRRVVGVLGEMLELGPSSARHHETTGFLGAQSGLGALLAVGGEGARVMAEAFAASGRPTLHVRKWQDGVEWIEGQIHDGDGVLVKGSRGIGLDGLVAWLLERKGD